MNSKKGFMGKPLGSTLDWIILFIIFISISYQIFYHTFLIKKFGDPRNPNGTMLEKAGPERKGIYKALIKEKIDD